MKSKTDRLELLVRWLKVENALISKIIQRNYNQHRNQPFMRYTKLAIKQTHQFTRLLKSNIKSSKQSREELNDLSVKASEIIIRAGAELSRIHVHKHFTQLITSLIACLARLYILIKKWQKSALAV